MKRSEMLKFIKGLLEIGREYPLDTQAENLLCHLEEKGMLPPGYLKPIPFYDGYQYPLIPGDFKNEKGLWCTPGVCEWESEDE